MTTPTRNRALVALTMVLSVASTAPAGAQRGQHPPMKPDSAHADSSMAMSMQPGDHGMADMMTGPLGISHARMGSGTSWVPDSSPMHANHKMWGDWTVMLHGAAFGQHDDQGSTRGDRQLGMVDWEMLMAMRKIGSGLLHLHGMASLEPATIGARGYPLLLQTGESYQGQPLHDRQHPHDAFMELAAIYQQPIASNLAFELYGGPVGEPAIGPVAFMHRPSAQNDPLAPLGHHWQDATHISFGVATASVYSRLWKLEGSWFNGVEPDENRWNIETGRFDSYSTRFTINPNGGMSLSAWYGFLPHPERLHPEESVHRYGASAMYAARGIGGGAWATTALWSANLRNGRVENSALAESNLEIGLRNAVFGRLEYVRKSAEDLVLGRSIPPTREFDIRSLVGGYVREVAAIRGGSIGVGGRASLNFVPRELQPFYGTRTPAGIDVYVRVRPNVMRAESGDGMTMKMPGMQR